MAHDEALLMSQKPATTAPHYEAYGWQHCSEHPPVSHISFAGLSARRRRAVAQYALVAIVRKRLCLDASLYETLQILSLTMFETTQLDQLLTLEPLGSISSSMPNQLNLF